MVIFFLAASISIIVLNKQNYGHITLEIPKIEKYQNYDIITIKSRPISLKKGADITTKDQLFFYPKEGYITEITPSLIGTGDKEILHHAVIADIFEGRDTACPSYKTLIFATGSEMTPFLAPISYGYKLKPLKNLFYLETHWQNLQNKEFSNIQFQYKIKVSKNTARPLHVVRLDASPVCDQHSSLVVQPHSIQTFSAKTSYIAPYNGKIVLAGGHIHQYAKSLIILKNKEKVIEFLPNFDENGKVLSIPPVYPQELHINRGDRIDLESTYSNPLNSPIEAMAIAFIYLAKN